MVEISALMIFAGALAVTAGSPGPSIAALVARVLARGPGSVLPFLMAMWIGEAIWLTAAVFGLSTLAESLSSVFFVLKWIGAAYLLYLAWKMWSAPTGFDPSEIPDHTSPQKMFAAGMVLTLGNPKIVIFYLALLPAIIDLQTLTVTGWLELTVTMLLILILIDLIWVVLAASARRLLKTPAAVRTANRLSAGIMAGAATAIVTR